MLPRGLWNGGVASTSGPLALPVTGHPRRRPDCGQHSHQHVAQTAATLAAQNRIIIGVGVYRPTPGRRECRAWCGRGLSRRKSCGGGSSSSSSGCQECDYIAAGLRRKVWYFIVCCVDLGRRTVCIQSVLFCSGTAALCSAYLGNCRDDLTEAGVGTAV